MSNLRFFKPESEMNDYVFIKVWTHRNRYIDVTLDKEKMIKQNEHQVCFEKEYLEEEINSQVYAAGTAPINARGIRNLSL